MGNECVIARFGVGLPNCKQHVSFTPFLVVPFKRKRAHASCEVLYQNNGFDVFDLLNQHLCARNVDTLTLQPRVPRGMLYTNLLQLCYRPNPVNTTSNDEKDSNLTETQL